MSQHHDASTVALERREILADELVLAAPAFVATLNDDTGKSAIGTIPSSVRAFAASSPTSGFSAIEIQRRAVGPKDVLLKILYAGICHSDIHTVRQEWHAETYPIVPGHEIIGRVIAVGDAVSKFRVGDIGGVGCMVDSCGTCDNCLDDREQNCTSGTTMTYDAPDLISGGMTRGGYSDRIVVTERFVIRIPPGVDLAATTPLLCAGITTFSPMQHWKVARGQKVGIIGLGGLGHVALKLAVARGAEVTVFTTSHGKLADALRMGATEAVLSTDAAAMKGQAGRFGFIIATVPEAFDVNPYLEALALDGTLVSVGALTHLPGVNGGALALGRKNLAGSMIGGIAETQAVIDYCAARSITAEIEVIGVNDIAMAYDRVVGKDVRYRFVIDMAASKVAPVH